MNKIYLACCPKGPTGGANSVAHQVKSLTPPTVRLAHVHGAQGDCTLLGRKGIEKMPEDQAPALLVSYFYLENFLKFQSEYCYRDWALDSGAFSAFNSGKTIDLRQYIEKCQELLSKDKTLSEVFSLDVIGDEKGSIKNCEAMWKAGVPAIPTYHFGEPIAALDYLAKSYPKIALGGVARKKIGFKLQFARACFARVWPKKIHGFGYGSEQYVKALPFHSTDATSWELRPCGFGSWAAFGKMSVRGSNQNLRAEVEFYLKLERYAQSYWAKEMKLLDEDASYPKLQLGFSGNHTGGGIRKLVALGKPPALRLAVAIQRETQHTKRLAKLIGKGKPK